MPGIPDLCRYCPVERGSRVALSLSLPPSSFLSSLVSHSLFRFLSLPLGISFSYSVGTLHKGRPTYRCTAHVLEVNLFRGLLRRQRPGVPRFPEDDPLKTWSSLFEYLVRSMH